MGFVEEMGRRGEERGRGGYMRMEEGGGDGGSGEEVGDDEVMVLQVLPFVEKVGNDAAARRLGHATHCRTFEDWSEYLSGRKRDISSHSSHQIASQHLDNAPPGHEPRPASSPT
jgi:hypothetical protein